LTISQIFESHTEGASKIALCGMWQEFNSYKVIISMSFISKETKTHAKRKKKR
jgi:hypothetical protein